MERFLEGSSAAPPVRQAQATYAAAPLAADQADFASAASYAERSRVLHEEAADESGIANATVMLARASWSRGDLDRAVDLLTSTLQTYRKLGDRQRLNAVLNNLGLVETERGNLERARGLLEESIILKRELGDELGAAGTLHNLGSPGGREGAPHPPENLQNENPAPPPKPRKQRGNSRPINRPGRA